MLFDGACAFCRRCIELARGLDGPEVLGGGRFDFAPYQSARHPLLTPPVRAACESAVHVITRRGQVLRGGRACFFLLEETSKSRLVRRLARLARSLPLVLLVEAGYATVARNRGFFSKFF